MRFAIALLLVAAAVGVACKGGGSGTPGALLTPLPGTNINAGDLVLQPADMPEGLPPLGQPAVANTEQAEGIFRTTGVPDEQIATWQLVAQVVQSYSATGNSRFAKDGPTSMGASATLSRTVGGALNFYTYSAAQLAQNRLANQATFIRLTIVSYEDRDQPVLGDEQRFLHIIAQDQDEPIDVEVYWAIWRRGPLVAGVFIQGRRGNVTLEQAAAVATTLDAGMQRALDELAAQVTPATPAATPATPPPSP